MASVKRELFTTRMAKSKKSVMPGGAYTAERNSDGTYNILDVPIFSAHTLPRPIFDEEKDEFVDMQIGSDWLHAALDSANRRFEEDQYLPPLRS